MRIAVYGTGGVGGYFGGRLAAAGHDVALIARGEHLRALRERGLRVESIEGDLHLPQVRATEDPREVGPVECVLCAVKAWQLPAVLPRLPSLVGHDTVVLPLLNGVEAADQIAASVGMEHVLGGVAWIRSEVAAPGLVRHAGVAPRVVLGELDGGLSPRTERLAAAFREAGIRAEASADVRSVLWSKLAFIAPTSAIGSVARVPIDAFRAVEPTRLLLVSAMEEIVAVAAARGVALPADTLQKTLGFVDGLPEGSTSSMQRDVEAGRPSELEAQCGAVVRMGAEASVPVPANEFLYAALLPRERQARRAAGLG